MKVKFEIEVTDEKGWIAIQQLCNLGCVTMGVDLSSKPDMTVRTPVIYPVFTPIPTPTPTVETKQPVVKPLECVVEAATPTETITLEQLAVAASTQLVDTGRKQELISLLGQFGVQSLVQLPTTQYPAFASHLRAKGVRI